MAFEPNNVINIMMSSFTMNMMTSLKDTTNFTFDKMRIFILLLILLINLNIKRIYINSMEYRIN